MPIEDYLQETLHRLEEKYKEMGVATGNVMFRDVGPHRQFRHETLTESLACYLKGIKFFIKCMCFATQTWTRTRGRCTLQNG